jgi:hypothetical protein
MWTKRLNKKKIPVKAAAHFEHGKLTRCVIKPISAGHSRIIIE